MTAQPRKMTNLKYKIGDKVWFIHNNALQEARIIGYCERFGGGYSFALSSDPYPSKPYNALWLDEERIFTSKEDLINSL